MKTKNAILNYITLAVPYVIIGFLGLFKIRLFLNILGAEIHGIYQLYTQLFVYLSLTEGGFTTAVIYHLYKPFAKKDYFMISKILSGARRIFYVIGFIIFIIGIIVSFNLHLFIKTNSFDFLYIQLAFIVFLISEIINYFFASYRITYNADQKLYKVNIITQTFLIFRSLIEMGLLLLGFDLLTILISHIFTSLVSNLIIMYMIKKDYKQIKFNEKEKNYEPVKDIKNIIPHKIGTLVANNIDIVIISSFINLTTVAIYSVYNYIITFINRLILHITPSITPGIGNFLVLQESKKKNLFYELNTLMFFLATILCIPISFFINPFIEMWVGNSMLVSNYTALFFVIILFFNIIKIPIHSFTGASGLFKETRLATIIESLVNLSFSLLLVKSYGIMGVLLGTIIAYIIDLNYRVHIIYKYIIKEKTFNYYKILLRHFLLIIIFSIVNYYISLIYKNYINLNFINWFLIGFIIFVINTLILLFLYSKIFSDFNLEKRFKHLIKKDGDIYEKKEDIDCA